MHNHFIFLGQRLGCCCYYVHNYHQSFNLYQHKRNIQYLLSRPRMQSKQVIKSIQSRLQLPSKRPSKSQTTNIFHKSYRIFVQFFIFLFLTKVTRSFQDLSVRKLILGSFFKKGGINLILVKIISWQEQFLGALLTIVLPINLIYN